MAFIQKIVNSFSGNKPINLDLDSHENKERKELLVDIPIIKHKTDSKTELTTGHVDFTKIVNFRLDAEYTKIKRSNEVQKIPLMVTVGAADVDLGKKRVGLDLVMVIDISGSMSGEKIKLVVETLLFIIDELKETDRLCLVAFDNVSEILTNLTPMTEENKTRFKKVVLTKIKSRNDTDIKKGLIDGYEVLLNRKEVNDVAAMFLLSDGQDTCGNTHESFKQALAEYDAKMNQKGMSYKINSFGYGEGHDEKVLAMIANYKEGNFYYVKTVQLVGECFVDCLGYLMSVFAGQAEVSVYMNGKSAIVKRYGTNWTQEVNPGKGTLKVGNLAVGKERNFIATVDVPPTGDLAEIKICSAILNYVAEGVNHMAEASLILPVVNDQDLGAKNLKVEQNVIREQAAETLKEATEDYKKGDVKMAKEKIRHFKADLEMKAAPKEEQARVASLMTEDIFEDQKNLMENEQILSKQAYRPMKAAYSASNQFQMAMNKKMAK